MVTRISFVLSTTIVLNYLIEAFTQQFFLRVNKSCTFEYNEIDRFHVTSSLSKIQN